MLDTLRVKSGKFILYVGALKTMNHITNSKFQYLNSFNLSFQFLKLALRVRRGSSQSSAWVYCFTYLEFVSIFLISAYSFLTSHNIDVVTALFCYLQGTTMEHNLDVYHDSRFPKIEPRRVLKIYKILP